MKEKAVILLSGGLDSAVCLACARSEGFEAHCVSFDYGQRHKAELLAASRVARAGGAHAHFVLPLDLRAIGGSALTSDIPVPKRNDEQAPPSEIPITYVPARNLILLSLALAHAEVIGARVLFIGVNRLDYSGYPDCRPQFIRDFERVARSATRVGSEGAAINVATPLMDLTKAQIITLGLSLGVDFSLTHSCYDPAPQGVACGRCDSCVLRARGFAEAKVPDPTRYM